MVVVGTVYGSVVDLLEVADCILPELFHLLNVFEVSWYWLIIDA